MGPHTQKFDDGMMQVAVDAVVFTIENGILKILLIERKYPPFKGKFALPGGFVRKDENLLQAAERELEEETGVSNIFLKQLRTFGDVGRDPRGRVIAIAFFALISADQILKASTDAQRAEWFVINKLPELAFDHKNIVETALRRLRYEIQATNIAFQILPEKFTLSELQRLYEVVLDKELDKRNFRKKIKEIDLVVETSEMTSGGAHRPARLHKFKRKKYQTVSEKANIFLK